nr:LOW QUALITY PROTEIN: putative POM121-like protein 1 [Pongo abelii]
MQLTTSQKERRFRPPGVPATAEAAPAAGPGSAACGPCSSALRPRGHRTTLSPPQARDPGDGAVAPASTGAPERQARGSHPVCLHTDKPQAGSPNQLNPNINGRRPVGLGGEACGLSQEPRSPERGRRGKGKAQVRDTPEGPRSRDDAGARPAGTPGRGRAGCAEAINQPTNEHCGNPAAALTAAPHRSLAGSSFELGAPVSLGTGSRRRPATWPVKKKVAGQLWLLLPRMLMPKKNRIAIYELLFKEEVTVVKKDVHVPKHLELADKNWCQDNSKKVFCDPARPVFLPGDSAFNLIAQVPQQASAVCAEFQGILQLSHYTEHKESLWDPGTGSHPFGAHNTRLSPDLWPGKIVLRALKESGTGMAEQDKDPRVQENPDDQRRVPEVTRDARSAFRPLSDNGGLSPFVPRPGPLQRDLHAQRSEFRYDQRSQTSWTSSCPELNGISSSYSSTGGLLGLKQRWGQASSHCQLTRSSSKTVSEDGPQAVSSGHTQCEKTADIAPGQTLALRNGSPRSQASRPHKRKLPLPSRRQGDPLMLPPPLELGFQVTAEDLDLEKEAAFQRINSELRAEAKAISDCRPSRPSHALSSLATGTSGVPTISKAPSMDAQQERHKSQDCLGPVAPLASAAEVPSTAPVSGKKHRPPGPLFSSSDPLPATSSHSRDSAQVTSLIPAPFPAASMDADIRRTTPGTSAPAAAAEAPPPSTLNPTSGSLLMEWMEALHISGPQSQLKQVPRGQVRYKQRSQTSWTSSGPNQNATSSSYSSTGGLPGLKRRWGPASSHCQLTRSSSKTIPGL